MLTFWPTLPPTPVSPGTYAFWMVRRPRVRLSRLKQLKPHAGVAFGRIRGLVAALALAAERPITDVTATPAASTEHALAKRLRMGIPSCFWNSPYRLPHSGGLGGQANTG